MGKLLTPHHILSLLLLLGCSSLILMGAVYGNQTNNNAQAKTNEGISDGKIATFAVTNLPSIELSLPSVVTLPIKPTADGQFKRASMDVNVSTNSTAGYTLMMSSSTNDLKRNPKINNNDYYIQTITEDYLCSGESDDSCSGFPENKWGYRVNGKDDSYKSLHTISSNARNIRETDIAATQSITTVYFGVNLDNTIPTGNYDGVDLTFIATTNLKLYSIDYHEGNSNVTDEVRGMTAQQTGPLETDTITNVTLASAPTRDNYEFIAWCTVEPTTNGNKTDECTGGETYTAGGTIELSIAGPVSAELWAMWKVKMPTITFNLNAGIKSVVISTVGSTGGQTITQESGKTAQLMSGETYSFTVTYENGYNAGSTPTVTGTGSISTVTEGSVYNYTVGSSASTISFTSQPRNDLSLTINFGGTGVSSVTLRKESSSGTIVDTVTASGGSINGLTYGATYYLQPVYAAGYEFNSWTSISGVTGLSATTAEPTFIMGVSNASVTVNAQQIGPQIIVKFDGGISNVQIGNKTCEVAAGCTYSLGFNSDYKITATTKSGYSFTVWSLDGAGTLTSTQYHTGGDTSATATITAMSDQKPDLAMQDVTSSDCTNTPTKVYDARDNQVYTIQKLKDGKCWLLDNLRLGNYEGSISLTNSTTNVADTFSLPQSKDNEGNFTSTTGYNNAAINTDYTHIMSTGGNYQGPIGTYYNFKAASAGTISGSSNTNVDTYDVCPKGWRMPTGGSTVNLNSNPTTGEYQNLYDQYAGTNQVVDFQTALRTPLSGFFRDGTPNYQESYGTFWSSTSITATYRYNLLVNASSVTPADNSSRHSGFSVRCVLK